MMMKRKWVGICTWGVAGILKMDEMLKNGSQESRNKHFSLNLPFYYLKEMLLSKVKRIGKIPYLGFWLVLKLIAATAATIIPV